MFKHVHICKGCAGNTYERTISWVQTGPEAYPASCTMGTGSFPGVKRPGRAVDHPPPSSAEVKERLELYLYSPSGPSWPVLGWPLPLLYHDCTLQRGDQPQHIPAFTHTWTSLKVPDTPLAFPSTVFVFSSSKLTSLVETTTWWFPFISVPPNTIKSVLQWSVKAVAVKRLFVSDHSAHYDWTGTAGDKCLPASFKCTLIRR
jgi:hypothetical protein